MTQSSDHHHRRQLQVGVVGILVAVFFGVTELLIPFVENENRLPEPTAQGIDVSSPSAEDSAKFSAEEAPDGSVKALTPGTCLSADTGALPCDVSHLKEVYSVAPNCSAKSLVAFLGGVDGRDVLRRDLTTSEQSDGACVVELPAEAAITRSVQNVLSDNLTEDRSPWVRRCFDARSEQDVDCGSYHTGEYVWEKSRDSLEIVNCSAHASEYVGTSIGPLSYELALEDLSTNDTELCRISVKGSNTLEGSIRNLGFRPVPLGPA